MSIKIVSVSLDEEIIRAADEMVKDRVDISSRSHLITTLILKEYKRLHKVLK